MMRERRGLSQSHAQATALRDGVSPAQVGLILGNHPTLGGANLP